MAGSLKMSWKPVPMTDLSLIVLIAKTISLNVRRPIAKNWSQRNYSEPPD